MNERGGHDPGTDGLTWRQVLADTSARLGAFDARWIVAEASGFEGAELVVHLDDPVTQRHLAHHDAMVTRREQGEPLQYVLGRWGFRTLDLAVDRRALIPRPETEVVVDVALAELDRQGAQTRTCHVADLGTGTGAIALSIAAERPRTLVWASDVSADAAALARSNVAGLGRSGTRVRVLEGSWFEPFDAELRGRFELVVSNPPYVADEDPVDESVREHEPSLALFAGPDGLDALRVLCAQVGEWLVPGGAFVAEIGADQAQAAGQLATAAGLVDVVVTEDLAGRPRVLRGRSLSTRLADQA